METRDRRPWRDWGFAFLLALPIFLFYAAHFAAELLDPTHIGTGFVQKDQAEYMASAREFIDGQHAGLLYAQPSTPSYDEKPAVVQLHLLALSVVWRVSGADPGILFVVYGLVFTLLGIRVFMALFDHVVPLKGTSRRVGQLVFVWGGGVLSLVGAVVAWTNGYHGADLLKQAMCIDPCSGWWSMNLGRNQIVPNEAFYHAVVFTALLCLLKQRYFITLLLTVMLIWCHPFSGVQLTGILIAWSVAELVLVRPTIVPVWFPISLIAAIVPYAWYVLEWVPKNANPNLADSLRLNYNVAWYSSVCAYLLVLGFVLARVKLGKGPARLWKDPSFRLFSMMALACFALENNELVISPPLQPAHFTRGYLWSALFLLGAPWLFYTAWPWLSNRSFRFRRVAAAGAVLFLLSDNISFFTVASGSQLHSKYAGMWLQKDDYDAMAALERTDAQRVLVVCETPKLGYATSVYTRFRSFCGHSMDDMATEIRCEGQEAYFEGKILDPALGGELFVIAGKQRGDFVPPGRAHMIHENDTYRVWHVNAP
ncbi:MAG: hypothetical protein IPO90_08305 [Flavobacteriales bacterium]|nr:hypothetical protein [Flavobacteriales bacterium]